MIISIDEEKAFDKKQHPFMINKKQLSKLRIEGNFYCLIKDAKKIYTKHHTYQWNTESISFKTGEKTRVLTIATSTEHYTSGLNQKGKARKWY